MWEKKVKINIEKKIRVFGVGKRGSTQDRKPDKMGDHGGCAILKVFA